LRHETLTDEIRETAALYALHSLSQHEARAFELHLLDRCRICETELREFEKVVADLGIGAGEMQPPEYVADLLMARIEHESEREPSAQRREPPAEVSAGPKLSGIAVQPPSSPRLWKIIVPWTIAAVFAVAAFLALYAWREARQGASDTGAKLAVTQEDIRRLRAEVQSEKTKRQELAEFADLLNTPGARLIRLAGQTSSPSSSAVVLWNTQENRWLINANLPPAPQGKVYQLWFVTVSSKVSAGLLPADPSGHVFTAINVPPNLSQFAVAVVTLEPGGGSSQPTDPIFLLGRVG
jgi:hypothetical protein